MVTKTTKTTSTIKPTKTKSRKTSNQTKMKTTSTSARPAHGHRDMHVQEAAKETSNPTIGADILTVMAPSRADAILSMQSDTNPPWFFPERANLARLRYLFARITRLHAIPNCRITMNASITCLEGHNPPCPYLNHTQSGEDLANSSTPEYEVSEPQMFNIMDLIYTLTPTFDIDVNPSLSVTLNASFTCHYGLLDDCVLDYKFNGYDLRNTTLMVDASVTQQAAQALSRNGHATSPAEPKPSVVIDLTKLNFVDLVNNMLDATNIEEVKKAEIFLNVDAKCEEKNGGERVLTLLSPCLGSHWTIQDPQQVGNTEQAG